VTKQKILHIIRKSLPWRPTEATSECGKRGGDMVELEWTLTQQWMTWKNQYGSRAVLPGDATQRVCKTCWDTCLRWGGTRATLAMQLFREIETESAKHYMRDPTWKEALVERELQALARLADLHRDEFDLLLAGADPDVVSSLDREYERKRVELEMLLGADGEGVDLRAEGLDEAGAD
jgi:hypothetical protein